MTKIRVYDTDGEFRGGLFKLHVHTRLNSKVWDGAPHDEYSEVLMDIGDRQWFLVQVARKPEYQGPEDSPEEFDAASRAIRYSDGDAARWFRRNGYDIPEYLAAVVGAADLAPATVARQAIPPLPRNIRAIFELLCGLPAGEALNSREIVGKLAKSKVTISDSNVRKLISEHREALQIQTSRAGYYVDPGDRPKQAT